MPALLDEVLGGSEIEITRHGRLVARLVPVRNAKGSKGKLTGIAMTAASEEDLFTIGAGLVGKIQSHHLQTR